MLDGKPQYVTVMAESDEPGGWRATKETSGCLIDVNSGATIARGFCMPHSPRVYNGRLLVLDSGRGQMAIVDTSSGKYDVVESFPGYTRGLTFVGPFAFVGLSQIRETAVFGGVPIAEKRDQLRCGVAAVDMRSGRSVAYLEFVTGVNEIFAVEAIQDSSQPAVIGPIPEADERQDVWVVPPGLGWPQMKHR